MRARPPVRRVRRAMLIPKPLHVLARLDPGARGSSRTSHLLRSAQDAQIWESGGHSSGRGMVGNDAAAYVDRILRGALPRRSPSAFEMVLNLKTANALRLSVPQFLF